MRVFTSVGLILCILVVLLPPVRGDDEKKDLDALIKAIQNGGKEARLNALGELRNMGSRGRPAVRAILPLLRDNDEKVREAAASALAEIGPGPEAIPALVEAMKDEETGWDAARALVAVGPAAIPALTRALHDSDDNVRSNAVYALGEFGPAAKDCDARADRPVRKGTCRGPCGYCQHLGRNRQRCKIRRSFARRIASRPFP